MGTRCPAAPPGKPAAPGVNGPAGGYTGCMTVKLTVVYDNPTDPEAFEAHYATAHMEVASKLPNVQRVETAKVFPKEDGSPTPAYRTADLYFADYDTAVATLATPEGKAVIDDIMTLSTGGVRLLLSEIEIS